MVRPVPAGGPLSKSYHCFTIVSSASEGPRRPAPDDVCIRTANPASTGMTEFPSLRPYAPFAGLNRGSAVIIDGPGEPITWDETMLVFAVPVPWFPGGFAPGDRFVIENESGSLGIAGRGSRPAAGSISAAHSGSAGPDREVVAAPADVAQMHERDVRPGEHLPDDGQGWSPSPSRMPSAMFPFRS